MAERVTNQCSVVCQDWPSSLAEWIRNSGEQLLSRSTAILQIFQEDLLPAQGWDIFLTYLNSLKRSKSFLTLTCLVISLLHFHLHNTIMTVWCAHLHFVSLGALFFHRYSLQGHFFASFAVRAVKFQIRRHKVRRYLFLFFLCIAFNPPRFFKCSQNLLGFFLKEIFVQIA